MENETMIIIEKRDDIRACILQAVNDSDSDDELCEKIAYMAMTDGDEVYSFLLEVLTSMELDADSAKQLWERAIEHSKNLAKSLDRPIGVVVALHDLLTNIEQQITRPKIIELDTYSKIAKSAVTDGLTGLYNSAFFRTELEKEIEKCTRFGSFISLIMFDIDNFKKFNDTYGHRAGDMALREFAAVMKEQARQIDILARYGGEEFACILPMTNTNGALVVAERIRSAIEKRDIPLKKDKSKFAHITCSGGVATFGGEAADFSEQLIDKADRALYRAKAEGKNCIFVDFIEKREFLRVGFPLLLSYRRVNDMVKENAIKTINLGGGGVLFRCSEKFEISSVIELEFSIPDLPEERLTVLGRVVRVEEMDNGNIDVGVRFLEIDRKDRTRLYRVLFEQKKHSRFFSLVK
jgi:diguanylate cyclase (GGDEF)-like protein